jgi:hypothetical protein
VRLLPLKKKKSLFKARIAKHYIKTQNGEKKLPKTFKNVYTTIVTAVLCPHILL